MGTTEHSALGTRWVYDATGDPVWAAALATAILTGGTQADIYYEVDGVQERRESRTKVQGSGAAGDRGAGPCRARPGRGARRRLRRRAVRRDAHGHLARRRTGRHRRDPGLGDVADPADWMLSKADRGNPRTTLDDQHPGDEAWSHGNLVRPLVHGATYFAELFERLEGTRPGDLVLFTDWQGDADERLTGQEGSEVVEVLARADERGVDVRGLVWRSHSKVLGFTSEVNRRLGKQLQARGAEALLDMRVRMGGSHHQKMVVIRYPDDPTRDVAYVGGIDLCHSRRDDIEHHGDPQPMEGLSSEYGETPPWHDMMAAISGPAVHDVETVFRERWLDPTPLTRNVVALRQGQAAGHGHGPRPASGAGTAAAPGRGRHAHRPAARAPTPTCATAATTRSPAAASAASPAATPRR